MTNLASLIKQERSLELELDLRDRIDPAVCYQYSEHGEYLVDHVVWFSMGDLVAATRYERSLHLW